MNTKNPFNVDGMGVTTPKGKALWCKNVTPDRTFNKEGDLSTYIIFDPNDKDVQLFLEPLEKMCDEAFNQAQKELPPVKAKELKKRHIAQPDTDKDGNDTGMIKVKFKLGRVDLRKADGKNHVVKTVDAKKNEIQNPPIVGNGSTIRCAGFAFPYYTASSKEIGVSILWNSLQIIDLVQAGGGDDFGEEEGYVAGSEAGFESVPF